MIPVEKTVNTARRHVALRQDMSEHGEIGEEEGMRGGEITFEWRPEKEVVGGVRTGQMAAIGGRKSVDARLWS